MVLRNCFPNDSVRGGKLVFSLVTFSTDYISLLVKFHKVVNVFHCELFRGA